MATNPNLLRQPAPNPYMSGGLGSVIPNLRGLTGSASSIIQSELGGLPNPAETRTANAAWGAGAGLPPGTPFLENRGRRLYQSEIENRQRQGIQDLLKFLQGYSGTVAPTANATLAANQRASELSWDRAMAERERQLAQSRLNAGPPKKEYSYMPGSGIGVAPDFKAYRYFR